MSQDNGSFNQDNDSLSDEIDFINIHEDYHSTERVGPPPRPGPMLTLHKHGLSTSESYQPQKMTPRDQEKRRVQRLMSSKQITMPPESASDLVCTVEGLPELTRIMAHRLAAYSVLAGGSRMQLPWPTAAIPDGTMIEQARFQRVALCCTVQVLSDRYAAALMRFFRLSDGLESKRRRLRAITEFQLLHQQSQEEDEANESFDFIDRAIKPDTVARAARSVAEDSRVAREALRHSIVMWVLVRKEVQRYNRLLVSL